jgi:hypothetical protein
MSAKKHLQRLGLVVRDRVTGFEGTVHSICFDLYGCVQGLVMPGVDADGKLQEGHFFDVKRLTALGETPVMERPDFSLPEIGPAVKPKMRA